MAINILETPGSPVMEVQVSGKLTRSDYDQWEPRFAALREAHGKIGIVFNMVDFHGWEPEALWSELKFDFKHYDQVERFAMIGERRWEKEIGLLGQLFSSAEVRYFDRSQIDEARHWVSEAFAAHKP